VYNGPRIVLSQVVTEPGHGILQQSRKAHDVRTSLNADGFGLSWYAPKLTPFPAVYKEITPAWSNQNLQNLVKVTKSHLVLAHVRAASTGSVVQTNCHPFCWRNLSFMHNGTVAYFSSIRRKMMAMLSDSAFSIIQGSTDSEVLFAMFVTNFESICNFKKNSSDVPYDPTLYTASDLSLALSTTLTQVHKLILEHERSTPKSTLAAEVAQQVEDVEDSEGDGASILECTEGFGRLNLVATDGTNIVASRYTTSQPESVHSLYFSHGSQYKCGKDGQCSVERTIQNAEQRVVVISSEPISCGFDCDEVPVNHIVVVSKDSVKTVSV